MDWGESASERVHPLRWTATVPQPFFFSSLLGFLSPTVLPHEEPQDPELGLLDLPCGGCGIRDNILVVGFGPQFLAYVDVGRLPPNGTAILMQWSQSIGGE